MALALQSSSGLGRLAPQAGNTGSNPVCNANAMLPSSSGLGRLAPQAGNDGSNPSGSAIDPNYKPAIRCPWSGVECDCKEFPWMVDGFVPPVCGNLMKDKMPAMLAFRKVNPHAVPHR